MAFWLLVWAGQPLYGDLNLTSNNTSERNRRDAQARELLLELITIDRLREKYRTGRVAMQLDNKRQAVLSNLMSALR
jgi:hypothetical protein